jgi:hypothetical protein
MTRIRGTGLPVGSLTEADWQRQVYDLLDLYGWDYRYHVTRSKMTPWGWPDIVAIRRRDRRLLFAELKAERTAVTPDQYGLLELLLDVSRGGTTDGYPRWRHLGTDDIMPGLARVDVELWRPSDVDRVMAVLR